MNNERKNIMEKINENKYVKKTKKSLLSLLFSRAGAFFLLILIQIVLMVVLYKKLGINLSVLIGGDRVLTLILMVIILNMDSIGPDYKISWFILMTLVPAFGLAVFLLDHFNLGYKKEQKKIMELEKVCRKYYNRDLDLVEELKISDKRIYNYQNYFYSMGGFPTYRNTSTKYYQVGEDAFADILKAVRNAKDFIFIEIFIIDYGHMWGTLLEELVKKAEEGVEVRLLFDGTNSLIRVKSNFVDEMESLGIKCKIFSPLIPILSTYYNNRDHRKIFVIDNEVGFTGGINLADEYINVYERFGHWKDCGLRLEGAAVESFTLMFLQMWADSVEEASTFSRYLPKKTNPQAQGICAPFSDSPMNGEDYGKNSILTMLNNANDYVYIMTPYLIIEDELINAMTNATKRGVDVRICMPHIPDKKIAFAMAKTHYEHLIKNGVRIFEYTPGFSHSKVWLSDDSSGFVGTINLDYRALYLNFECGVWMKDTSALIEMKNDFDVFFNIATPISLEDAKNRPLLTKVVGFLAKPFSTLF